MKITSLLLLFFAISSASCKENNKILVDSCKIDSHLVDSFFLENQFNAISLNRLDGYRQNTGCAKIDSFILDHLSMMQFERNSKSTYLDSLFKAIEIPNFKDIVKTKNNVFIRLVVDKTIYNPPNLLIVDLQTNNKIISTSSFRVNFNKDCNFPFIQSGNNLDFSSTCFELTQKSTSKPPIKEWHELYSLKNESELMSTTFIEHGVRLCHDSHYFISYYDSLEYGDHIYEFDRSCPGKQTAIHMFAQKILSMQDFPL